MRRGLAASRSQAVSTIAAGDVLVGGAVAERPARLVAPDEPIVVRAARDRFVGRGAHKLVAALDAFAIDPAGCRALDVGASTGGFTDCLLQRGASSVVALDVGYGQLHESLRADPRVEVRERCNIRDATVEGLDGRFDLVVADLSFISLRLVAPVLVDLVTGSGQLVVLVKPQFEAGRREAAKGRGVIADRSIWRRVLDEVIAAFGEAGATMMGVMPSPIRGAEGNVEFLLWARPGPAAVPDLVDSCIAAAIDAIDAVDATDDDGNGPR